MPNFDAGHYFLTVIAPIRVESVMVNGESHSHRHLLFNVLEKMPAGERTAASAGKGIAVAAPFAKNKRTHLARFAVLDQVVFNGRASDDTLLDLLLNLFRKPEQTTNPLKPQWVDLLRSPFLIFVVDFDAKDGSDAELKSYLTGLWGDMSKELRDTFQHCYGFENVTTGDQFFDYVKKCQVETTMPFNDYWSVMPPLSDFPFNKYVWVAGVPAAISILGVLALPVLLLLRLSYGSVAPLTVGFWVTIVALLVTAAVVFYVWTKFKAQADAPFPTSPAPAPGSDLRTVLKALYLQRAFTELAINVQGKSDQDLYIAFRDFVAIHKPDSVDGPTQQPGVIGV